MRDVCNFIPAKEYDGNLNFYHFVYETEYRRFCQGFFHSKYRTILVSKGSGIFKTKGRIYPLEAGTLVFIFPYQPFEMEASDDFAFVYITFDGSGAEKLLATVGITDDRSVFQNFESVYDFWITSIRRINRTNANTLTESVLMYTLSFINDEPEKLEQTDRFEHVLDYIDGNFTDSGLSLKKVSEIFFYSEKYLSALFSKKMNVKFTEYINELRISYARTLIEKERPPVSVLASKSGFSDPFYFSKVFKKIVGQTPSEYMKNKAQA